VSNCSILVGLPPSVSCPAAVVADVGFAYSSFAVSGGGSAGPRLFSVETGDLNSLSIASSTGLVFGTPNQAGFANFTLRVRDSSGADGFSPLCSISIFPPPTISCPASTAIRTVPFSSNFVVSGGAPIVSFSLSAGSSLPLGLSLNASSLSLSGVPSATGLYSFQAQLVDLANGTATTTCSISVIESASVTCPLAFATRGESYSSFASASGGSGSGYVFSIVSGSLPSGLTLFRFFFFFFRFFFFSNEIVVTDPFRVFHQMWRVSLLRFRWLTVSEQRVQELVRSMYR
jgi:hypothetical protein